MAMTLNCSDLGIADCNYEAHGETNVEVLKLMVEHLRTHHHLDIKEDDVLVGDRTVGADVAVVVRRLREKLEIGPVGDEDRFEKPPL